VQGDRHLERFVAEDPQVRGEAAKGRPSNPCYKLDSFL
jgi:hypothetical protein